MAARRCSRCGRNWPNHSDYRVCAWCLEETSFMQNAKPMDPEEAAAEVGKAKFERWYEAWDRKRKGPTPEELGKREADAEIEGYWRELDTATKI